MTAPQQPRVRPSFTSHASRRNVTPQAVEEGQGERRAEGAAAERNIQELEEIRRYEDFTTIDWVQDAAKEQMRRRARRKANAGLVKRAGRWGIRHRIWQMYDAGQAWIVVTLVGAAIGLDAAFLNIATEWLSDIKRGHCTTAFYLNEKFCCWGEDECDEWQQWTGFFPLDWFIYLLYSILFAYAAANLVKAFAPYAAGSGVSEIKCIIAGFVMKDFLGFWTLLIKSITLPLAIGSGLSVGKEGPSVHYAVCAGSVISRYFEKYKRNASKTREILTASAAAGVAVAFGSPIGGVIFSLEEMTSHFPLKTMWRSYFCCLVATAVLAALNPFRTGQLVMFQVHYDRSWYFFEVPFFIIIGVFGGLYGAFVIRWNLRFQAFRKKYLSKYAIPEAMVLAAFTALLCYPNVFLRMEMTEEMAVLFRECEGSDKHRVCIKEIRWQTALSLVYATVVRLFLVIISYGCKVPAGIFVPSMAIGASFGRVVGIIVQALHDSYPDSAFFGACSPDGECITPGTFALLGAAAALSGIMHITVSVVVIMFELTGALTYILPTMIVVGSTKAVNSYFHGGGIADRMIAFNGFPFLDTKEESNLHVPVSKPMTPANDLTLLSARGHTIAELENMLSSSPYSGFPVITDRNTRTVLGYIGRTELIYALQKARDESQASGDAKVIFAHMSASRSRPRASTTDSNAAPPAAGPSDTAYLPQTPLALQTPTSLIPPVTFESLPSRTDDAEDSPRGFPSDVSQVVDLARFVDPTPLSVAPRLPLATALEIFNKMGPRVILVERRGILLGLVTIKDVLRFSAASEAAERGAHGATSSNGDGPDRAARRYERQAWAVLQGMASTLGACVGRATGGRIQLRGDSGRVRVAGVDLGPGPSTDPRDARGVGANETPEDEQSLLARMSIVSMTSESERGVSRELDGEEPGSRR